MLYIGYLIILDGQSIKKISFENSHFLAPEAGKLHEAACIFSKLCGRQNRRAQNSASGGQKCRTFWGP